jgi:hypothetical protein
MEPDISSVYARIRHKYSISLSSSLELDCKSPVDFPVLHGRSALGYFEVFFDDVSFPFYAMRENGEVYAHWHLQTLDEVEKTVADFMEGKPSAIPF